MIDCVQNHTLFVYDRGGRRRLWELGDLDLVRWGRVRDDISEASTTMSGRSCDNQADVLTQIEAGRHELVVYRGDQRVWEGPITRTAFTRTTFEVAARDIGHYMSRTAMQKAYSNKYPKTDYVISRIKKIITAELARKEAIGYNLLPYMNYHQTPTDAKTSAVTERFQMNVWEHIDNLAAKAGTDYTTVGRAFHVWDTHEAPFGMTPTVTENDFLGDITVTQYGLDLATRAISTNGDGTVGIAGGVHPYYGEVDFLTTAYDEETDSGPAPTVAELVSQAERNRSNRLPTPTELRIPDNSTINPSGVLSVEHLVPGILIPVLFQLGVRPFSQIQKLDRVNFEETAAGEKITAAMSPRPRTNQDEE